MYHVIDSSPGCAIPIVHDIETAVAADDRNGRDGPRRAT